MPRSTIVSDSRAYLRSLNGRPRKDFGFVTSSEKLTELIAQTGLNLP